MDDERRLPSKDYIECARRLRQLHALIRSGDGDSDQAEELRDEMDDFWIRMSPEEREWSGDLSADLHVLGEASSLFLDRSTDGAVRQQLLDAGRHDDWVRLRSLLISDANSVDHFDRILFRAIYWAALKDFESSLEFLTSLIGRMEEFRSEIEVMQSTIDRLARIEPSPGGITNVRDRGPDALRRIDRVADEINRLIADVEAMISSGVTVGDDPDGWPAVKARFFQAEEHFRAFSQSAA
jgi:hypothetical protein